MVDLSTLDFNSKPAWLIAIAVVLFLLPGILKGMAPFVPPLSTAMQSHAKRVEAEEEREAAALRHKLETNGLRLGQELKGWDRMLDILETSLNRMWDDRMSSEANYEKVSGELRELRYQIARMGDTLSLHGQQVAKLTDEQERFSERLGQVPEQVASLGAVLLDGTRDG